MAEDAYNLEGALRQIATDALAATKKLSRADQPSPLLERITAKLEDMILLLGGDNGNTDA